MKRIFAFFLSLSVLASLTAAAGASSTQLKSLNTPASLKASAVTAPVDEALRSQVESHLYDYMAYLCAAGDPLSASKINQWLVLNKKYFNSNQLTLISEALKTLDEEHYQNLVFMEYKDPTVSIVLSVLTGMLGVDRFYIHDIGLGIGKLLTAGGLGVWWLVDIFCIEGATKKHNFEEFNQFMQMIQ